MPSPQRRLEPGERVELDVRPHGRRLVLPVLAVPLVVGVASFCAGVAPHTRYLAQERLVVLGLAVLAAGWTSLRPWLRWRATHYTVTSHRLLVRTGVLHRSAQGVGLGGAVVTVRRTLPQRLLRSGTVTVHGAGGNAPVVLADVPQAEQVQRLLARLSLPADRSAAGPAADDLWAGPVGGPGVRP